MVRTDVNCTIFHFVFSLFVAIKAMELLGI
jgi:hypothetical protein